MTRPRTIARALLRDRRGGTTIYVVWLIAFMAVCGVAVDSLNALRARSELQATADSAALSAVLALPLDEDEARSRAGSFIERMMPEAAQGRIFDEDDIRFGRWDPATKTVRLDQSPHDAAVVTLARSSAQGSQVYGSFLQLLPGFTSFDVSAGSIAQVKWRGCRKDEGLIAAGTVNMKSTNTFGDGYCIFGRLGVSLFNNNDFLGDAEGALVGVGTTAFLNDDCTGLTLNGSGGAPPECDMSSNPGLTEGRYASDLVSPSRLNDDFYWRMALYQDQLSGAVSVVEGINGDGYDVSFYASSEWRGTGGDSDKPNSTVQAVLEDGAKDKLVYLQCDDDGDMLILRRGQYRRLTLVTNCLLEIAGGSKKNPFAFVGVELISVSAASHPFDPEVALDRNILFRGNNFIGQTCVDGESAYILTTSGVQFEGENTHQGVFVTAMGGALVKGSNATADLTGALSIHAGGDIHLTSSSSFGVCPTPGEEVLVKPRTRLLL